MVDNQITCDLVNPTLELVPFRLTTKVSMHTNEDFLQNILRFCIIPYPAANESSETVTDRILPPS